MSRTLFGLIVLIVLGPAMVSRADVRATPVSAAPASLVLPADVQAAVDKAGDNASELMEALKLVPEPQRQGLYYLIAHMPAADRQSLTADFLLEHVRYAYRARAEMPWGRSVPEAVFREAVLPYAVVNERRDRWREDFYQRFARTAREAGTIEQAAVTLNQTIFSDFGVEYHPTKRPKPDQSPYETMEAGYASCTGLSILLVDALRAVGIPARLAGTFRWSDNSGNHTWVEVWDHSRWHALGASESAAYDEVWFTEKAAQAVPGSRTHGIYAAVFAPTGTTFPAAWDPDLDTVPGLDVTPRYLVPLSPPCSQEPTCG